jgi:glycosyltransferase involved in cell wall biosynthesis
MPVYGQAAYLDRALAGLLAQDLADWELVVVDDGTPDPGAVAQAVRRHADPRIRLDRLPRNAGLGAACNRGLELAAAPLVAYLPADDVLYPDHLTALVDALAGGAAMAVTGVRHHGGVDSPGPPDGFGAQLVQVAHRRTADRWVERSEQESDDLDRLFWHRLRRRSPPVPTGRVTCEWVDHPGQRHKAIREAYDGGLNVFRSRYAVAEPLRFHSTDGTEVDEVALYAALRERPRPPAPDGLRILLAGELSFNPERVLALADRGHRLLGTWTADGLGMNTVGPLPFGHVEEAGGGDPREVLRRARPDVVYALLNWRAVPFCAALLAAARAAGVPFVWHFKESPQQSIRRGEWPQLVDLVTGADAVVLSTVEEAGWLSLALPGRLDPACVPVVDGDLPSAHWLPAGPPPRRLSEVDGEVHTVVLGRALGIDAAAVRRLAAARVHLHLYGAVRAPGPRGEWASWVGAVGPAARPYLHLHPVVHQDRWAAELGRYDAGWLHRVPSRNGGDLRRAVWDDLNQPARLGPLAVAGLPVLQQRHPGHAVAMDRVVGQTGAGLLYADLDDLVDQLRRPDLLGPARAAMARHRDRFTFEAYVPELEAVFRALAGR